jgi:hypothetical protein
VSAYRISRVVTAAESLALVTLDQAKAALGIDPDDTSQDAALAGQIDSVSAAINAYCNRIFAVQEYTDQIRHVCGYWGEPLVVRQFPIVVEDGVPLVTVSEDGLALDAAYLELHPETGSLYRLDSAGAAPGAWGAALTLVEYTAGFVTVPPDVQGAALEWLGARWYSVGRDPALRSETVPDLLTQVYAGDAGAGTYGGAVPPGTRDLLAPYRIWFV